MAVPVTLGDRLGLGTPHPLFAIQAAREALLEYDVSADGQRFVVSSAGADAGPLAVLNWTAELPR